LFLHYADLNDPTTLRRIIFKIQPSEIYHLAGQSHVGLSFDIPESTCETTAISTLRLLETIRDMDKKPRFYHASSSEIFGKPLKSPQTEDTPFSPVNPYGCAKMFAHQMVKIYRSSFNIFACNGIAYNHESSRRGENFVTRKICRAAAYIKTGLQGELILGDLNAKRDWGYAPDYVYGMWLCLQHYTADDFLFATGELRSVRDIVYIAFNTLHLNPDKYIKYDPRFTRIQEPCELVGSFKKAEDKLGWRPKKHFEDMIREMTLHELELLEAK
jgi:GDPmannose 4,6-dehydratase